MTSQTNQKKRALFSAVVIAIVVTALFAMVYYFMSRDRDAILRELDASYLPKGEARYVKDIHLIDYNEQAFTETQFKGKWTFMFAGFTNCPDICPTTMLVLKAVWAQMPDYAKQSPPVQMIFLSVDPGRDSPKYLKDFVTYYHREFIGVTGKPEEIDKLVNQLGIYYGFDDAGDTKNYQVNHSGQIVLIDPEGKLRAIFSTPHNAATIVDSYIKIRKLHSSQ